VQKSFVLTDCQTFHILKNEGSCIKLSNDPYEIQDKPVPRIVQDPLSDQREALARRTTKNAIDGSVSYSGGNPDFRPGQTLDGAGDYSRGRKIELVDRAMNRVDLDGCHHIESCLLEAKAKASGSCE